LTTLVTMTWPAGDWFTAWAAMSAAGPETLPGELEFSCVHYQPQSRLLLDQGERAFHRADSAVEGVDVPAAAWGRPTPEPPDRAGQGRIQSSVDSQKGRQERGRAG
jgi:hypothetical protein